MKWLLSYFVLSLALLFTACQSTQRVEEATLLLPKDYTYNRQWQAARWVMVNDTFTVEVKGRGHSTFRQPKHPYDLRFASKQSLSGLPVHRHFTLLANFFDHSLLRNALAMEVARQTSLASVTPQWRFLSLHVNGEWQGVYWLSERQKSKVPDTDSLLKLDVYHWQVQQQKGLPLDTLPKAVRIDSLSFADWWIVNELCMNAEPNGPRSCYVRISRDGVVHAGPVWDFDMAFNELGVDDGGDLRPLKFMTMHQLPPFLQGKTIRWLSVDSFYADRSLIINDLLQDVRFRQMVASRWRLLRPRFARLITQLNAWQRQLKHLGELDQQQWNALDPARFDASPSWAEAVNRLKQVYRQRLRGLDKLQFKPLPLTPSPTGEGE